jgi:hypothetical protein
MCSIWSGEEVHAHRSSSLYVRVCSFVTSKVNHKVTYVPIWPRKQTLALLIETDDGIAY